MPALDVSTLTSVNQTALLVALRRAQESRRGDALFHDALAELVAASLAGDAMPERLRTADEEMARLSGDAVVLRTRWYDDEIEAAVRRGVRQVVLLGVGLDPRSLRMNLARDTRFFEVDQAPMLDVRQRLLDDSGLTVKYDRRPITADLPADDLPELLVAAGFRPDLPSLFVAEGLLFYLTGAAVDRPLTQVAGLTTAGGALLVEYPAQQALSGDGTDDLTVTADFDRDTRPSPWDLLGPAHWHVTCRTLNDLATTFGRPLPDQIDERRGGARWWYAGAQRT